MTKPKVKNDEVEFDYLSLTQGQQWHEIIGMSNT